MKVVSENCINEVLVTLILSADINRLLLFNQKEIVTASQIVEVLHLPDLLINALNVLYSKVAGLCREYQLKRDDIYLKNICELEKRYINIFRLIRSNSIELNQISNIGMILQSAFNTYLYQLIKYLLSITSESDYTDVTFYHYSMFPVENRIIMSSIYNDENFHRIHELLRDNFFIKRIVKKRLGKTILKRDKDSLLEQDSLIIQEEG